MHPPLEIRPPGFNVEAWFSRSKRHIIIFPVQRPSVSRHGLTLELRPPIRRLVSCRELITIYTEATMRALHGKLVERVN